MAFWVALADELGADRVVGLAEEPAVRARARHLAHALAAEGPGQHQVARHLGRLPPALSLDCVDVIDHRADERPVRRVARVQLHRRRRSGGSPVVAKATPWIGYGCETERITVTLSITRARRGSSSQTSSPGTLDGIDASSPRISTGRVGLGVERLELAGRAVQEQQDARLRLAEPLAARARFPLGLARGRHAGEPQPEQPQRPDVEQVAAVRPSHSRFGPPRTRIMWPPRSLRTPGCGTPLSRPISRAFHTLAGI